MVFDPTQSATPDITVIENALVIPFGTGRPKGRYRGIARAAGVYDAAGRYQPLGQCWRNTDIPITFEPEGALPEPEGKPIRGTWLYGGMLYQHFGHFLAESTSRLWAVDHLAGGIDGVLFLPKKQMNRPKRFVAPLQPLLDMFSPHFARAQAPTSPVRVERLVLAPQGFGTGAMMAGNPEYRTFVQQSFGRSIAAEGAEKIYISRSRLFSKRGRYFGEARIEALLAAEGYRIFHPQEHPIEEQIAHYKAARKIISSDSSALHLAAFFTTPEDRLAIILRRPGNTIDDFLLQFESFSGHRPDVIDALNGRLYQFEGARLAQMSEIYAEIDFPALGTALQAAGYISSTQGWPESDPAEIAAECANLSERLGATIVAVGNNAP